MRRLASVPRPDWVSRVESVGLTYHLHNHASVPRPYWNESACYEFTSAEIDQAEAAIKDLHFLLIDTAEEAIKRGWWERLGIPEHAVPAILHSWQRDDFSLYGRFDLAWSPGGVPKLLEYNADTPTSLIEASVAQWKWLEETRPGLDQFNSIHERLIDGWKRFATLQPTVKAVDFTSIVDRGEDQQTLSYLMDTAQQAGFQTRWTELAELGYDHQHGCFVCGDRGVVPSEPMLACFKLYPWEWVFHSSAAEYLDRAPTHWIEPPWKALLSNKGILACAWELHPGHPNLLPTFLDEKLAGKNYVQKPVLSREGANITVFEGGIPVSETLGEYGEEGYVYQVLADIPNFDGNRPVFGGWVVDHEPAGLGVRESDGLVTDNLSRFVPHYFV